MAGESEPQAIFSTRHFTLDSNFGKFPVVEVTPLQPKTDIPVIIAPGWSEPPGVFHKTQQVLAERGRKSFVFNHPSENGDNSSYPNSPNPELRKALTLMELINNSECQHVDIIAHSEGAIYSAIAATLDPQKIRNLILIGPGGMIGKDTLITLAGRLSKKVARNIAQGITDRDTTETVVQANTGAFKYVVKNPLHRLYKEPLAIAESNIGPLLTFLKDLGLGIVVIHHTRDEAFPMHRIQEHARSHQMDGILAVTGLHDDMYNHPEKYTMAAEEMLSALERKQKKNNAVTNSDQGK